MLRLSDGHSPSAAGPTSTVVDEYGFEISCTPEQLAVRQQCADKAHQLVGKWGKLGGPKELPKPDKLKKYCRKGVPPQFRGWVWLQTSGAAARKAGQMANYYEAMVHMGEATSDWEHQIELDLPRTFPANQWISSEEGQTALRRVLLAFSVHKPQVGYCQGMNYIGAMLLLVMDRGEEDAFWVLVSLIDDGGILYRDMYANNLAGTHVELRSLDELVTSKLPKLHAHLQALNCDISIIATDWFLCIFCTTLPSETAARVWDALFSEGPKIIFRVALALLKMHEEALLAQDNPGYVLRELRTVVSQMHDRDRLMKVAFDGIGSMPMAKIDNFRERKQEVVDVEMRRRESRQALQAAIKESHSEGNEFTALGMSGFAEKIRSSYKARLGGSGAATPEQNGSPAKQRA